MKICKNTKDSYDWISFNSEVVRNVMNFLYNLELDITSPELASYRAILYLANELQASFFFTYITDS